MNLSFESSLAGQAFNAYANYAISKSLMRYQSKLARKDAKWTATELPTYNRQGMESAGFNPILAYSQGTGQMSNPSIPSFDAGFDISSAVNAYNQLRATDAAVDLNKARAAESLMRQANLASATELNKYKLHHPDTLKVGNKFLNLNLPMSLSSAWNKSKELVMQIGKDSVTDIQSASEAFKDSKGNPSPSGASDFFQRLPNHGMGYRPGYDGPGQW